MHCRIRPGKLARTSFSPSFHLLPRHWTRPKKWVSFPVTSHVNARNCHKYCQERPLRRLFSTEQYSSLSFLLYVLVSEWVSSIWCVCITNSLSPSYFQVLRPNRVCSWNLEQSLVGKSSPTIPMQLPVLVLQGEWLIIIERRVGRSSGSC